MVSAFCVATDLWREPRTPSLREGVDADVGGSISGGEWSGVDGRAVRSFFPPSAPSLRDGVEAFEDAGNGEVDLRDAVRCEAFFEPPRLPSLEDFGFLSGSGESDSDSEVVAEAVATAVADFPRWSAEGCEFRGALARLALRLPTLEGLIFVSGDGESSE